MTACRCLSQSVENGILARRLGALYKSLPKTHLFDFVWLDVVVANVFNAVPRPDELIDCHALILPNESLSQMCLPTDCRSAVALFSDRLQRLVSQGFAQPRPQNVVAAKVNLFDPVDNCSQRSYKQSSVTAPVQR